jgi:hypothetical protein
MSQQSNDNSVNLFKKVYGGLHNLTDKKFLLSREIPWQQNAMVGDEFKEAFVLTSEVGFTLAGQDQDAFTINPAIAGAVKQSGIKPFQTVLSSILPWAFMSRASDNNDEKAFYNSTKYVMQNHIRSHSRLKEIMRFHGQSAGKLGYVSYAPAGTIYRGAVYSGAGDVTLTRADGTTIAFTDGVNVAEKAILFAPGNYAAGIWTGMTNVNVRQIDANNVVVGAGKLVKNDADLGIIYVDFVPVAATSTTSHRLCFEGMELDKEMIGLKKILTNTGTLFGINAATYELWGSNVLNLNQKRLSLKAIQLAVMLAVNKGGLEDPIDVLVSPRVFAYMINDEAALRRYGAEYKSTATNGFEAIEFYSANGLNRIRPYRYVMEGEAYGVRFEDWVRSGSAEVSFNIPGMNQEVIFPLENQAGYVVRSFSDEYVICRSPATQFFIAGIDPEAIAY